MQFPFYSHGARLSNHVRRTAVMMCGAAAEAIVGGGGVDGVTRWKKVN